MQLEGVRNRACLGGSVWSDDCWFHHHVRFNLLTRNESELIASLLFSYLSPKILSSIWLGLPQGAPLQLDKYLQKQYSLVCDVWWLDDQSLLYGCDHMFSYCDRIYIIMCLLL